MGYLVVGNIRGIEQHKVTMSEPTQTEELLQAFLLSMPGVSNEQVLSAGLCAATEARKFAAPRIRTRVSRMIDKYSAVELSVA